jgi:hypothetical protein
MTNTSTVEPLHRWTSAPEPPEDIQQGPPGPAARKTPIDLRLYIERRVLEQHGQGFVSLLLDEGIGVGSVLDLVRRGRPTDPQGPDLRVPDQPAGTCP